MKKRKLMCGRVIMQIALMTGMACMAMAQQAQDLIVVNAKIVPMSDPGFNTNTGTVAEAMAIRAGRVVAIGTAAQARAAVPANTRTLDLKGKMVLPGFIITHEHPSDWDLTNPYLVKKTIPEEIAIHVFAEGTPAEQLDQMEKGIKAAAQRARPGQWIRAVLSFGKNYEYYHTVRGWFSAGHGHPYIPEPRVLKANLDALAPNNPVTVRAAFTGQSYNTKAIEAIKAIEFPGKEAISINDKGIGAGVGGYRTFEPELLFRNRVDLLIELEKLGLPWWAGYGTTSWNTSIYSPNFLTAYHEMDRKGEMAIRLSWNWGWEFDYKNPYVVADMVGRTGKGSDYMWFGGLGEAFGIGNECSTIQPITDEGRARKQACSTVPGTPLYDSIYAVVKAGGRLTGYHVGGDMELDNVLELIEKASRDGGLNDEQIRSKRHGTDHGYGQPRPDQAARISKLGMAQGVTNITIFERPPYMFQNFGEAMMNLIAPRKTLVDAKVYNSFETDRPLATTEWNLFDILALGITRKSWDGKPYGINQAVDRVTALKTATNWSAYYLNKDNDIGSLQVGKFGDFIVIDKDYLAISDDQVKDVNILMTVVGGKVIHLVPSLARDLGLQPAGPQVELNSPTVQIIK